jgi:hypothetical protein
MLCQMLTTVQYCVQMVGIIIMKEWLFLRSNKFSLDYCHYAKAMEGSPMDHLSPFYVKLLCFPLQHTSLYSSLCNQFVYRDAGGDKLMIACTSDNCLDLFSLSSGSCRGIILQVVRTKLQVPPPPPSNGLEINKTNCLC